MQFPRNVHFGASIATLARCVCTGTGDGADGRRDARTDSGAGVTGTSFFGALHVRFIDDLTGCAVGVGSTFGGRVHVRLATGVDVTSTGAGRSGSASLSLVSPMVRNGSVRALSDVPASTISVPPKLSFRLSFRCFSTSMSLSSGLGTALDA